MKTNNRRGFGLARVSMGEMTDLLAKYDALPKREIHLNAPHVNGPERDRMLTEQDEQGWGMTPPDRIPANWREVRGPAKDRKKNIAAGTNLMQNVFGGAK